MVERRLLTPEFVDAAAPPGTGERWIADTAVRGFGLRLWATKQGGRKAFALRMSDCHGFSWRGTFHLNGRHAQTMRFLKPHRQFSLGDYLDAARGWAREERKNLSRDLDSHEEKERQNIIRMNQNRIKRVALGDAAERIIQNMRRRGLSERYIDRTDKLFATYVPESMRRRQLQDLTAKAIAKVLVDEKLSGANAQILRSFISKIFDHASYSYGRFSRVRSSIAPEFRELWEKNRDVRFPELRELNKDNYKELFRILEKEPRWQQALAIRLFFKFRIPVQRVMRARWCQILDGAWYPYAPGERRFWREYNEPIDAEAKRLLALITGRIQKTFGASRFLFPSPACPGQSIKTVQSVWRDALEKAAIRYYPLKEFSRSYREYNNPSYMFWFLDYYGDMFDQVRNTAELSKSLTRRLKKEINSNEYRIEQRSKENLICCRQSAC